MKSTRMTGIGVAFVATASCMAGTPLGTGFTYQGQLKQNGQPFTGTASLGFALYDASTDGNLLGTQSVGGVSVNGGLFTVILDFGVPAYIDGQAGWLEISLNGMKLSPRQPLTPAPFSLNTRGISVKPAGADPS